MVIEWLQPLGATTFHGGIDIPAPQGTNLISVIDGDVSFVGFMGSGGCTVCVKNSNYTITFHHVSPNFLVQTGQHVYKGQVIAQVGPKYVYGFINNIYKDYTGNPTNGSTTGPHLHFTIQQGRKYLNPIDFFKI